MGANDTTDWDSIGLSNDFIFGKVMRNPVLLKELLCRILPQMQIDYIEYPQLQKAIRPDADARSIRLDVYVKDDKNTVYDIEIQTVNTKELPKRSRYYQGVMDIQLIDKGVSYKKLNQSYIIFICLSDIFGKGRHLYTFENRCREDSGLILQDGAIKIFLNAESTMNDVSADLKAFFDYIAGQRPKDAYAEALDRAVSEAKRNREWRHEYMTLLMRDQENIEKGIEQGTEKERRKIILNMLKEGLSCEQICRLCDAAEEEVELCRKFIGGSENNKI